MLIKDVMTHNKPDSLCINEFSNKIMKCFSCVILNRAQNTKVPKIISQVCVNSIIYTDEHGVYFNLSTYSYIHKTVCHKYNFVDEKMDFIPKRLNCFIMNLNERLKCEKDVKLFAYLIF
ncbi:hypothetical protein DMUE_0163 [Dictyocoela muelleri]|nr:hypothetical protein DMUE_0163 [Dictyocoela muelleri]